MTSLNTSVSTSRSPTNSAADDPSARLRWGVYLLLIALGTGSVLGRILSVNSVDYVRLETHLEREFKAGKRGNDWQKQRPFLSANDRSRWCTIRSLVEHGTYAIDDIVSQPNWDTIDMVKHDELGNESPEPGQGHLYSSKPPLFSTLLAGEYWLIHKATGRTLGTHPYAIGRFMLVTVNLVPLMIYFVILAKLVERLGTTDWGRIFAMSCATLGTFLTTFAVTLNNHLPAAVTAALTIYAALRIVADGDRRPRYFVAAGFFGAFTAANELPALAFFALVTLWLLWKAPRLTLLAYAPAALVVGAAAMGTNYASHHSWRPPYAHRSDGDNWYAFKYVRDGKVRESYWSDPKARSPIDQGEPSRATYALHALVGHHGIFSLTPVWLLSVAGLAMLCASRDSARRELGALIAAASLVCMAFYFSRGQIDRNYGGMTSGFRWVFWFAPLWIVGLLPVADRMASKWWLQVLAAILLGLSVMSAAFPTWNPWIQPWLLDFLTHLNWVRLGGQ